VTVDRPEGDPVKRRPHERAIDVFVRHQRETAHRAGLDALGPLRGLLQFVVEFTTTVASVVHLVDVPIVVRECGTNLREPDVELVRDVAGRRPGRPRTGVRGDRGA
jgi:hypothetical protein